MPQKVSQVHEIDKVVGANLRLFRTSKAMSQSTLAEALEVKFQQIQKYEKGSNRISASKLWMMCQVLDVEPRDFFDGLSSTGAKSDHELIDRVAFFKHPRAAMLLEAFLDIKNPNFELGVIQLCRSLKKDAER